MDGSGNVFISGAPFGRRIWKVSPDGLINIVPGITAYTVKALAVDPFDRLYMACRPFSGGTCEIQRMDPNGMISRIAGTESCAFSQDGGLAVNTPLSDPNDVDMDSSGNIF